MRRNKESKSKSKKKSNPARKTYTICIGKGRENDLRVFRDPCLNHDENGWNALANKEPQSLLFWQQSRNKPILCPSHALENVVFRWKEFQIKKYFTENKNIIPPKNKYRQKERETICECSKTHVSITMKMGYRHSRIKSRILFFSSYTTVAEKRKYPI